MYNEHLKGLTATEIWRTPGKEQILTAVMIKLGQPLEKSGCLLCISDALTAIQNEISKMPTKAKYRLKAVTIGKLGYPLSNDNLTDDLARQLLRRWPELHTKFFILPKNWQEDISAPQEAEKLEHEEAAATETKAKPRRKKQAKKEIEKEIE